MTDHLDLDDVGYLAGGPAMIRDEGLLLSALGRPQQSVLGLDAYPDPWTKAAALGESISRNHPLIDRNKRTTFEAMLLFLDYNGVPYTDPSDEEAVPFMLRLAQGGFANDTAETARALRALLGGG
ncbi:hypothetical protein KCMC57_up60770 [Kitasatospora sp. CMC57]|uniref:Fido domain-containing protein n=1 Tax=Kitasatospora sp. CMC57 TaxID=3231513 RepID=A0AB33K7P7_9ACTN